MIGITNDLLEIGVTVNSAIRITERHGHDVDLPFGYGMIYSLCKIRQLFTVNEHLFCDSNDYDETEKHITTLTLI